VLWSLPSVGLGPPGRAPATYYLKLDQPANYSACGFILGNKLMDRAYAEKLLPLLAAQYYIGKAAIGTGKPLT